MGSRNLLVEEPATVSPCPHCPRLAETYDIRRVPFRLRERVVQGHLRVEGVDTDASEELIGRHVEEWGVNCYS